ncbi:ABC transporter permease [Deinococcus cellulosilyticus]|uniref:Xylose transport system permease protein XylH n=1 Tax=Deinococcus cellulosilyticus (strain DSM 18568 / NBRC 106333 / KACC 11606 / 5516J-15) TaxID=1223518 RepID=A0A511N0A1_DEIC1|nr:ABC transporter permease [Deinococcus cellulosilyticus]GEM46272.1 sugar ABC transporter permease [Deinococcus cellulosilyticus NBRC 106333 = KACC 11606]
MNPSMSKPQDERLKKISPLKKLLSRPELGSVAGLILVFSFFALTAGNQGFLTVSGTVNYLEVAAQLGILAVTVSLLMIAGEFDLSIGSMIGAAGMVMAISVTQFGLPVWLGIVLAFVFALLFGWLNGFLVMRTKLPSFIVTLASMFILRGLTLALTRMVSGSTRVSGLKDAAAGDPLALLFSGSLLGLPVSVWWWVLLTLILSWVLLQTRYGNWIFGVGGDANASRNVGVPVARVKISLFMLTAASATLLAVIQILNTGSADVLRGELKELEAVAAAVIGGTLLTGGFGSVIGAAIGALILGMVQQGIFFTGIDTDWFKAIMGSMLLGAVLLNNHLRKKATEVK